MAQTGQLTGQAYDAGGNPIARPGAWASSAPAVASVNGAGLVTGHTPGTAAITYTVDGVVSNASTVTVRKAIAQVIVTPNPAVIPVEGVLQFAYTLKDAGGVTLNNGDYDAPVWTSSDVGKATMSLFNAGQATGVAPGPTTITATVEGVAGAVVASVEAVLPTSLLRYVPGDNLVAKGGVHTRASTATYVDVNGIIQTAASGVVRDGHYVGGVRTLLLEAIASTNLLLDNTVRGGFAGGENFGTSNGVTAPDGSNNAEHLTSTAGNAYFETLGFYSLTPGEHYTVSLFQRWSAGASPWMRLQERDNNSNVSRYSWFNVQTGVVGTADAAHTVRMEAFAAGYYRWSVSFIATSAAHQFLLWPTTADATGPAAAVGVSYDLWGGQMEVGRVATSVIITAGSVVTRAADRLYFGVPADVQSLSILWDGHQLHPHHAPGGRRLYNLGGDVDPRVIAAVADDGGAMVGSRVRLAGSEAYLQSAGAIVLGQRLEHHTTLAADGTANYRLSRNGAPESVDGPVAAGVVAGTWSLARIYVSTDDGNTADGRNLVALRKLLIMPGVASLATMRAG